MQTKELHKEVIDTQALRNRLEATTSVTKMCRKFVCVGDASRQLEVGLAAGKASSNTDVGVPTKENDKRPGP